MLVEIFVRGLGGPWELKKKHRITKSKLLRRAYGFLYTRYLQSKGSWISLDAKLEGDICFPHGIYGIFISGGVKIGRSCVIFQHVTIGSNTLVDSKGLGAPWIGDRCYIGAGAKIVGNVKIGNNVRIAANAVVYKDVPDNCVVTSGKQNILPKDEALDNKFYHKYRGRWECFENGEWVSVREQVKISLLERHFPE